MRRLVVTAAVTLTALVVTAGPLAAAPTVARRYADTVFTKVKLRSNVTYGVALDARTHLPVALKLDMYTPAGDTDKHRPAIVWVHGGGFAYGDKTSPYMEDEAFQFAAKGYVSVSIDYRLSSPVCATNGVASCPVAITQATQDAQTAVRFLRAKATTYGIDTTRIAIGGSSAGAITALNVGYTGTVDKTGSNQGYSSAVEAVQSVSGCAIGTAPAARGAPALLFNGTADPLVAYACARSTVARAKAVRLQVFLVTWVGEGHVPYGPNRTQILDTTALFFYNALHLASAS